MRGASLLALAALASLGVDVGDVGDRKRRCHGCRMPSNRCPCRHCGSCSTDGREPGDRCACHGPPADPVGPVGATGATGPHGGICDPSNRTPLTAEMVAAGAWPGPTGPTGGGSP